MNFVHRWEDYYNRTQLDPGDVELTGWLPDHFLDWIFCWLNKVWTALAIDLHSHFRSHGTGSASPRPVRVLHCCLELSTRLLLDIHDCLRKSLISSEFTCISCLMFIFRRSKCCYARIRYKLVDRAHFCLQRRRRDKILHQFLLLPRVVLPQSRCPNLTRYKIIFVFVYLFWFCIRSSFRTNS